MEERRNAQRYPLELHATCIGANGNAQKHCKVIEISKQGVAVQLYSRDKFSIGKNITLEIDIPARREPIKAVLVLRWIKEVHDEVGYNYLAGGELTAIEKTDMRNLLEYGFENLRKHLEESD